MVRPDEIGTVASIEQAAAGNGAVVRRIDLNGQFRCGGSPVYVRWVEELLGLRPGGPQPWQADDAFELFLADSPDQMEWELRGKLDQGTWPGSRPGSAGPGASRARTAPWSMTW